MGMPQCKLKIEVSISAEIICLQRFMGHDIVRMRPAVGVGVRFVVGELSQHATGKYVCCANTFENAGRGS